MTINTTVAISDQRTSKEGIDNSFTSNGATDITVRHLTVLDHLLYPDPISWRMYHETIVPGMHPDAQDHIYRKDHILIDAKGKLTCVGLEEVERTADALRELMSNNPNRAKEIYHFLEPVAQKAILQNLPEIYYLGVHEPAESTYRKKHIE